MNKFAVIWISLVLFMVSSQINFSVEACPKPVTLTEDNFIKYINCKKASLTNTRYGKRSHIEEPYLVPEETQLIDDDVDLNEILQKFYKFLKHTNK